MDVSDIFIHSSVEEHLDLFYNLTIMNKNAIKICMQILYGHNFQIM